MVFSFDVLYNDHVLQLKYEKANRNRKEVRTLSVAALDDPDVKLPLEMKRKIVVRERIVGTSKLSLFF